MVVHRYKIRSRDRREGREEKEGEGCLLKVNSCGQFIL